MVEKRVKKQQVTNDGKPSPVERRGVQSIDIGMRILSILAASNEPLPLKKISAEVGMAPSNVHRYLASFISSGLLRQDADTSRYDLGQLALRVGLSALSRINILEMARPEMKRISRESGFMALATVLGDQGPVVVRLQQPTPPIILSISLGTTLPLLRSPSGLVFLAYQPEEATLHLVDRELRLGAQYALASGTPKNIAEVRQTAARTRDAGYAMNDVDISPGLRAIGCPIFDLQGEIIAAISLVGPDPTLGPDHPVLQDLVAVCQQLSEEAGYQPSR
jgi:DNA-binding IclR family transcriptional regulator